MSCAQPFLAALAPFHFLCGLLSSLFEYDVLETRKPLICWSALKKVILSCDNLATLEACLAKAHLMIAIVTCDLFA